MGAPILSDDSVFAFTPQAGLGAAVDLGTTTLVAQLLDLQTGHVLGVRMALNTQARYGADIMSRIEFALSGNQGLLGEAIRKQIGGMIAELLAGAAADANELRRIVIVGNTVMHHLFCGLDVTPLSHEPFEPEDIGLQVCCADELGWRFARNSTVHFLPCLGGFVGSDLLAGVLATRLHERESLAALIDLGTNGEIVVGNCERLLCASTAAGPAFEGARISMGMRAATGAISEIIVRDGKFHAHVIGNVPPRGICGSGLVDAVAGGLELGLILPSGRLAAGDSLTIAPPVSLTQRDIRELQLAKGAIAAGIRILTEQWGAQLNDLSQIFLAGAFGNYLNCASAKRIGLLNFPQKKIQSVGNSALLGAKLALFNAGNDLAYASIRNKVKHVSLNEESQFQEVFADEMGFPSASRPALV